MCIFGEAISSKSNSNQPSVEIVPNEGDLHGNAVTREVEVKREEVTKSKEITSSCG